jgi:hypothetical protein
VKVEEQKPLAPGMDPYVFISWDKKSREPTLILGGGLTEDVHLPDLVERLQFLADELVARQKGKTNG